MSRALGKMIVAARLWESGKVGDDELREAVRTYKYELELVVQDDLDREEAAQLRRERRKRKPPEPQPLKRTA